MRKALLPLAVCLICINQLQAQTSKTDDVKKSLATTNKDTVAWVHSGIFTFGINEGLLHNWQAGGELASLAVSSVFHGNLTYFHHNLVWTNDLDLAYGLNYIYSTGFTPRKTDDRIDFTSNLGTKLKNSKNFYFAGLFNFKSQFTKGYDYSDSNWMQKPTSDMFSPAYLILAAGMEYKRGEDLSLFLSPLAGREILASARYTSLTKSGAFGIDSGKTSKLQFGAYFSGRYKKDLRKGITFSTRLDLYSNYLAKNTTNAAGNIVKKDNPGNIQVFWDNLLVVKTYKSLSATLGVTIAYDNNIPFVKKTTIDPTTGKTVNVDQPADGFGWVQLSQIFTIGIAYKF